MVRFLALLFLPLSAYQLTLFIDARPLDYTSAAALWHSLHQQQDVSFGHAWIRLEHEDYVLEGGHTGEFGVVQPRYLEGVLCSRGPNPISYLWQSQPDGRFEHGSGGHTSTHSATLSLTEEQFDQIRSFIEEGHYPFSTYSLTRNQCTTFVVQVAALAGVHLSHQVTVPIEKRLGKRRLWTDPAYSEITLSTPEALASNPQFQSHSPSRDSRCQRRPCCL